MSLIAKYSFYSFIILFAQMIICCAVAENVKISSKIPLAIESQFNQRPLDLVKNMDEGVLKNTLQECVQQAVRTTKFSIAHRGAPLYFPEHTKEGYIAAAKMGAGLIECDVTFTKDRVLVCRHSQCDLHTTTNILTTALKSRCSQPFQPAKIDAKTNKLLKSATAKCCTSDITLSEFKSLKGRRDSKNQRAKTIKEYLTVKPDNQMMQYSGTATLLSHVESIHLFKSLGVGFIPELKIPEVEMPFEGDYTHAEYAQQLIDEYKAAGITADKVWLQSFNPADIIYWRIHEKEFGKQAILLDGRSQLSFFKPNDPKTWILSMETLAKMGIRMIAPPIWVLLKLEGNEIKPSLYVKKAKQAGLDIITWTLERSGPLANGGGWYYQTVNPVINNDGDVYQVLDVLARDVGVKGVFSDWPSTVSYYANCMGIDE